MKTFLARFAHTGLLAGILAGLMASGACGIASAQFAGKSAPPSYFQAGQASPIATYGAYNSYPFMQVGACESSCAAPCVVACEPTCCEPVCEPSCGGCGQCNDCCEDDCDDDCCEDDCCHDYCCKDPCKVFYIGFSGGWACRDTVNEAGDPATFLEFDDGFHINFQFGREFDLCRLEVEISHFNNDVLVAGAGVPGVGNFVGLADGNVNLTAFMFNAYHDWDWADWRIDPYFGGGIGFAQSEINGLLPDFFAGAPLNLDNQSVNATSDYAFAWQLRAGFNYDCTARTTLYMGYRYFRVEELTFSAFPFGTFNPNGGREHCIEWGLRVAF